MNKKTEISTCDDGFSLPVKTLMNFDRQLSEAERITVEVYLNGRTPNWTPSSIKGLKEWVEGGTNMLNNGKIEGVNYE